MKKILTSASLFALGVAGLQAADKPWDVSLAVKGFYDDNYAAQHDGPLKDDSWGILVSPKLDVALTGDQTSFGANYMYTMRYYEGRSDNQIDHNHDFTAWVTHAFSERYSMSARENLVYSQEPTLTSGAGVVRNVGDVLHNDASASFAAQVSRLMEVQISYQNEYYDYRDNTAYAFILNRMEHKPGIELRYQVSPNTVGTVGYRARVSVQDKSAANSLNVLVHTPYVGVEHAFLPNLTAQGKVGVDFVDYYDNSAANSPINPYVDLSLKYDYTKGSFLQVGFVHDRNQTDAALLGAQDEETSSLYATISHSITTKLIASATGRYQHSEFNQGPVDGKADDIYGADLSLEYRINKNLSAVVGYTYDNVSSDIAGRGYDRNRVTFGMTASY
jgi:hypothetical protein